MYFLYAFLLLTMLRLSALTVVEDDESALSSSGSSAGRQLDLYESRRHYG